MSAQWPRTVWLAAKESFKGGRWKVLLWSIHGGKRYVPEDLLLAERILALGEARQRIRAVHDEGKRMMAYSEEHLGGLAQAVELIGELPKYFYAPQEIRLKAIEELADEVDAFIEGCQEGDMPASEACWKQTSEWLREKLVNPDLRLIEGPKT